MDSGFRFIVEEVFSVPGKGIVVKGRVENGSVPVGSEIGFLGTDGKWTGARVAAIEVSRKLVEEAATGQAANVLLQGVKKGQITRGTILMEVPAASVPVFSPQPQPSSPPVSATPSSPARGKAIHPPSSSWRTLFFIAIGILIILAVLYLQGDFRWR